MPLYRQEVQFNRLEIPLTRSTIAQWVIKCGLLVQPLNNLTREQLLAGHSVQMDGTQWQVHKELGKAAQSQSYMWIAQGGPPDSPIILFDYSPSRSQDVPVELLGDYTGFLQTDGHEGYNKECRDNGITQLGCWAHARRKFDEALNKYGDIISSGVGSPGASVGAVFIGTFVDEEQVWAHFDIAGVDYYEKEDATTPKNYSGWGVRTLDLYLRMNQPE